MRPRSRSEGTSANSMKPCATIKGMVFNTTDPQKFRGALRAAGFYAEWKEKYGPDAWAVFERQVGVLG
jgi:TRAP-type transport system periplasmic protein